MPAPPARPPSAAPLSVAAFFAVAAASCAPASARAQTRAVPDFAAVARADFPAWDTDGDGALSAEEVNALVNDPNVVGVHAAAVAAIKATLRSEKVTAPIPAGLFLTATRASAGPPTLRAMGGHYRLAVGRLRRTKTVLFQPDDPKLARLDQGKTSDCYILAAVASKIVCDPDGLRRMFAPLPGGACRVAFPSGTTVVVPPLTDTQFALSGSAAGGSQWFHVLEEAYARLRDEKRPENKRRAVPSDGIVGGGSPGRVMANLSGKRIVEMRLRPRGVEIPSAERVASLLPRLRAALTTAQENRRLVTAGVAPDIRRPPDINGRHAYAVLGYDPASDVVRVWNPHAQNFRPKGTPGVVYGYPTRRGVFDLPLSDFARVFTAVRWETATPLRSAVAAEAAKVTADGPDISDD